MAANAIVTNTRDDAENSGYLRHYLRKVRPTYPPVEVVPITEADRAAFRQRVNLQPGQPVIGMAARLATEKGVEYLAQALPIILEKYPTACSVVFGPASKCVWGGSLCTAAGPVIERLGDHWMFLGVVPEQANSAFFHECAVTVLPSLNSTDFFGLVQIELMLCGTPVVASGYPWYSPAGQHYWYGTAGTSRGCECAGPGDPFSFR